MVAKRVHQVRLSDIERAYAQRHGRTIVAGVRAIIDQHQTWAVRSRSLEEETDAAVLKAEALRQEVALQKKDLEQCWADRRRLLKQKNQIEHQNIAQAEALARLRRSKQAARAARNRWVLAFLVLGSCCTGGVFAYVWGWL